MLAGGRAPHALAAILPTDETASFRDAYARKALCRSGTGTDGCPSCAAWTEDGHPDLVIAGRWGEPPGVADCLAFQAQLHLKPVVSCRRLGVVSAAENLSLPAANSLLKTVEEPPATAVVLFLAERETLIPTIMSRVWTIRSPEAASAVICPHAPPEAPEWAQWLERTRKLSLDQLIAETDAWAAWYGERGEWGRAASLRNVAECSTKRHMPVSMVQDALYAILWEGVSGEEIFDDLRET